MKTLIYILLFSVNIYPQNGWSLTSGFSDVNTIRFVDTLYGWAGARYGYIFSTTDGGVNWMGTPRVTDQHIRSIFFVNRSKGWAVGNSGTIIATTNGGDSWFHQISGTNNPIYPLYFTDEHNGWAGTDSGIILKTTTGGENWVTHKFNQLGFINTIYFNNKDTGWIADGNGIWKTTNTGLSWEQKVSLSNIKSIVFTNSYTGWALRSVSAGPYFTFVYKTNNGGENWEEKKYDVNSIAIAGMSAIDTTHVWLVGQQSRVFITTDGGNNWTQYFLNSNGALTSVHFLDKNNGWAGSSNGIWRTTTGGLVSIVKEDILIDYYSLYQNYPNPFNPVTTITYQIPFSGMVTLKVYDVLGREVRTLVNEEKSAGNYSIEFNASSLSSGVYLYELRSGEFKLSKKFMLMK